jgi:hypothetical protein
MPRSINAPIDGFGATLKNRGMRRHLVPLETIRVQVLKINKKMIRGRSRQPKSLQGMG